MGSCPKCETGCESGAAGGAGGAPGRPGAGDGCGPSRRRVTVRGALLAGLVVLALLWLAGCSMLESGNRRTLNALDERAMPESAGARWAASPLALPAGFVALAADMVVVHPALSVDDAWGDTVDWLWTSRGETRFRRAVILPLVTIATPLVFVGDWVGRCLFPVDARDDAEDEAESA